MQHIVRTTGGGFLIESNGQAWMRAHRVAGGWRLEGGSEVQGWSLVHGAEGELVLRDELQAELARSMPLVGVEESDLKYILLADARLFRMRLRGPKEPRFELLGWEVPGAYLMGRPAGGGWVLFPTPAGSGLAGLAALTILFAAEILVAEDPAAAVEHEQA